MKPPRTQSQRGAFWMERRGKQMRGRLEAVSCTEGSLTPGLADAASVVQIEARLKHDKHKGALRSRKGPGAFLLSEIAR